MFITYDLKMIKNSKKKYDEVREYYKTRMVQLHALRRLKKHPALRSGVWRTRRRLNADEGQAEE